MTDQVADIARSGLKPSRLEYARRYSDDSGVEIGVIYDAADMRQMKIVSIDTADFDIGHLDFVINALLAVRALLNAAGGGSGADG